MLTGNEKRTEERFNIHCLVTFAQEQGWTKNISASGLYFLAVKELESKQQISLTIHFTNEPAMRCNGTVIRVEQHPFGYGIAVHFSELIFSA